MRYLIDCLSALEITFSTSGLKPKKNIFKKLERRSANLANPCSFFFYPFTLVLEYNSEDLVILQIIVMNEAIKLYFNMIARALNLLEIMARAWFFNMREP